MERFPHSPFGAELSLEEGLARAARTQPEDRNGRQRAAAALRRFLRDNPAHPRATEARVALAELAFERPRPNLVAAWHELTSPEFRRVDNPEDTRRRTDPLDGNRRRLARPALENERAAYLAIWLADTPGPTQDAKQAIALANRFLERSPNSSLAAEVRMKLCEIYFRQRGLFRRRDATRIAGGKNARFPAGGVRALSGRAGGVAQHEQHRPGQRGAPV